MPLMTMNFRLEAADGSGVEEYRIRDGEIEVCRKSSNGREAGRCSHDASQREGEWQRLSASEIASHVRENTAVAQWLRHRIGWRRLLLACTDQETLEMFGVPKAPEDQKAA